MPALVPFSRTATLGAAAATLTLSAIPQTAQHLLVRVRARSDNQTATGLFLGLRLNGDAGPNTYDGNTLRWTTSAAAQPDSGIDLEQFSLGDLTPSDTASGIWNEHLGLLPRYTQAEAHMWASMGFGRFDNVDTSAANFGTYLAGGQHVPSVLAAVTSLVVVPEAGNLAAGSSITVWGLLENADASTIARSAGTVALDFSADEFKDVPLSPGVNAFTATNPRLGRTISARLSGGDGTTSITLPAGTEKLSDSYVAGAAAWLVIRCVDESGPGYIASLRDVI